LENQINKHRSIARHIIDGSISIDSVSEFKNMLKIFPDNPALHSAFADLLVQKKFMQQAANFYGKAAGLYIGSGMLLPALLNKIMEWRVIKPTHRQARPFYDILKEADFEFTPLQVFFKSLSYPEIVAVTNRISRVRLPAGQMIKKIGDTEDHIYFIASGTVKETINKPVNDPKKSRRSVTIYLSENDMFGIIIPFKEKIVSLSFAEAITAVELGKISKPKLLEVCKKYPNVGQGIVNLHRANAAAIEKKAVQNARKSGRHPLPIRMNLEVYPEKSDGLFDTNPFILDGYSHDISIGGVCVVLDAKYANITSIFKTLNNAKINISFPGEAFTLNVWGKIVWSRNVSFEGEKTLALGIQFKEMTPKMSGMLVVFADMLVNS
jgi:CRP-like cAMP-binding protein